MKSYKFDFKNGCSYVSKNGIISKLIDGRFCYRPSSEQYGAKKKIENDLTWMNDIFYLCALEKNTFMKIQFASIVKSYYDKIFERISDA